MAEPNAVNDLPAPHTDDASAQIGGEDLAREADLIVPRISVEVFCTTAAFATSMQTAAADRRMAKASASVVMGGSGAAVKRYADHATPNLLIVETEAPGFGVFNELEELASVCAEDTRVIVVGPSNDVSLYRELMRQGVCEYLVSPSSPLQIIEAISSVFATPESAPAAKLVVVYGVRGGVGASMIAHNLAAEIAGVSDKDTVLVDLDLEFGTAALNFNIEAKHTIADALLDLENIDDVKVRRLLHPHTDRLMLLPAPADLKEKASLSDDGALTLFDTLRQSCDFLVVDAPHAWSSATRTALRQAESVVLVSTPDLACLRNLKSVYDWVVAERPHDAKPKIVMNQVGAAKRPEISQREFQEIIGATVDVAISYEPAAFGAAQNDGRLLSQVSGGQKPAAKIAELARTITGRLAKPAAKPAGGSVFSSMFGALKKG